MAIDNTFSFYSIPELIHILGNRFKDYRLRAGMTQKEVSEKTGVSTVTIYKFENGIASNISLGTFLLLLKAIDWIDSIDTLMPELPPSPYTNETKPKINQRARNKRQ